MKLISNGCDDMGIYKYVKDSTKGTDEELEVCDNNEGANCIRKEGVREGACCA
jgi:hypothetical protein